MGISKHFGRKNYAWRLDIVQNLCEFCQFCEFLYFCIFKLYITLDLCERSGTTLAVIDSDSFGLTFNCSTSLFLHPTVTLQVL